METSVYKRGRALSLLGIPEYLPWPPSPSWEKSVLLPLNKTCFLCLPQRASLMFKLQHFRKQNLSPITGGITAIVKYG